MVEQLLNITLNHYLVLAAFLFSVGVYSLILNRHSIIRMLMAIELILLSVNLNLVAFSKYLNDLNGQIFTIFILTVAAAEAAIGLAILVAYFRNRGVIDIDNMTSMKG